MVPHFTVGFGDDEKFVAQHIDLDHQAVGVSDAPVEPHRIGRTIWVMVLKPAGVAPCQGESFWLGQTVGKIVDEAGASPYWEPFPTESSVEYKNSEMPLGSWHEFEGVCAAAHVPNCSRYGPGEVDLWTFGEGLGSPSASIPVDIQVERVEAAPVFAEPTVVDLLAEELTDESMSILGEFPGRRVQLGSGGKAVDVLREAYGLDEGKFDDELNDLVLATQQAAGVTPDGIVDSDTWAVLDNQLLADHSE